MSLNSNFSLSGISTSSLNYTPTKYDFKPLISTPLPAPQLTQSHLLQLQAATPSYNPTNYTSPNPICDALTGTNSSIDKIRGGW